VPCLHCGVPSNPRALGANHHPSSNSYLNGVATTVIKKLLYISAAVPEGMAAAATRSARFKFTKIMAHAVLLHAVAIRTPRRMSPPCIVRSTLRLSQ
jgi:hypothetical protein